MAFDEILAARVREILADRSDVDEKKMFGGLAFMVRGHMSCGVIGQDLMVRVGPEGFEAALARPHARPMDFTGRPLNGMVYVGPEGSKSAADLRAWVETGVGFVGALPPKKAKMPRPSAKTTKKRP